MTLEADWPKPCLVRVSMLEEGGSKVTKSPPFLFSGIDLYII